jgi:hypothetical protein
MSVLSFEDGAGRRRIERRLKQIEDAVRLAIAALRDESMVPRRRMLHAEFFLTMYVSLDDVNKGEPPNE